MFNPWLELSLKAVQMGMEAAEIRADGARLNSARRMRTTDNASGSPRAHVRRSA